MGQERLSSPALMHVHYQVKIILDEVVNLFATKLQHWGWSSGLFWGISSTVFWCTILHRMNYSFITLFKQLYPTNVIFSSYCVLCRCNFSCIATFLNKRIRQYKIHFGSLVHFGLVSTPPYKILVTGLHVPWIHIFFRYLSHEFSVLLSINLSGLSLINWTPAVRICIWWLLLPYNWCDTDLKKQSPAPPTSIDCKQSAPNLDCIKFSEEIGEFNCIVELWFCIKGLIITSWWSVLYWVLDLLSLKFTYYNWSYDSHNCKKTMINIDVLYILVSLSCDNAC